jgi:iron complex outermembrane recepter protein
VLAAVGGNPNLKPEDARTITAGFVVTGPTDSMWQNLKVSLDYYDIDIANAITAGIGTQQAVTSCYQGLGSACALVPRDQYGNITEIIDTYVNFNREHTAGWDLQVNYHQQMGPGVGSAALSVNHVFLYDLISGLGVYTNTVGVQGLNSTIGGERAWTSNTTFSYTMPNESVSLRVYWFGNGYNSATLIGPGQPGYSPYLANSETWNSIPGAAYLYLSGTYDIWKSGDRDLQIYGAIDNLLNKSPPYVVDSNNSANTLYPEYDILGRLFRIGLRAKL